MKPVTPHPLRFIAARDRQQPGHARQVMVKRRVETRDLGQIRKAAMKTLDQQDFFGQMFALRRLEAPAPVLKKTLPVSSLSSSSSGANASPPSTSNASPTARKRSR